MLLTGGCYLGFWRRFAVSVLGNVDAALEIGAIFDDDASGFDIPDNRSPRSQRDAALRFNVALDGAINDDFLGLDVRVHLAVGAHSQAVPEVQLAIQIPFQIEL